MGCDMQNVKIAFVLSAPDQRPQQSVSIMSQNRDDIPMRDEYGFSKGVRGKHYQAY